MLKFPSNSKPPWFFLLLILFVRSSPAQSSAQAIVWHPWSDGVFTQAAREHKLVLLNLEASWCHWCHVMDHQTYNDPAVQELIGKNYIAVKVDQSSRPDVSNRYHGYDLPVTVMFKADGSEIIRRQGYLPPRRMASILQAVIDDPSPGPSVKPDPAITYSATPTFSPALLAELKKTFKSQYDLPGQGWSFGLKYLDTDSIEYATVLARHGDRSQEQQVRDMLQAAQKLLDPAWGGAYQSLVVALNATDPKPGTRYTRVQIGGKLDSTGDSWNEPHYEKLLFTQAQVIQIYASSFGQWRAPEYLAAAQSTDDYVRRFLTSPEGAFYVSQDIDVVGVEDSAAYFASDDTKRRALGIPQVNTQLYARENGWMINALCALYAVTGDATTLQQAERSARWVIAHRSLAGGGFSHAEHDTAGPYLDDTLAVGQGFLALYEVTGDHDWLKRATAAGHFISANFPSGSGAGFVTSKTPTDRSYTPQPERGENTQLARFANLLTHYSGDKDNEEMASRAMRYLATREIATAELSAPVLLAEFQFTHPPVHITVVGGKKDKAAQALFRSASGVGLAYQRFEWWDPAEGPLPRNDVQYPSFSRAVAFLCTASTCSSPITDPHILQLLSAKSVE